MQLVVSIGINLILNIELILKLAGALGFEPRYAGIKTLCLTAWRRPNWMLMTNLNHALVVRDNILAGVFTNVNCLLIFFVPLTYKYVTCYSILGESALALLVERLADHQYF